MKLSIIIPNYNKEKYLEPLLAHLAEQLAPEVEVIIVDDASTDGSMRIINKYKDKFSIYQNERNMYNSYTRNVGLKVAQGEYVTFIDSDDDIKPDFVATILEAMQTAHDGYFFDYEVRNVANTGSVEKGWNTMVWSKVYKKSVIDAHNIKFNVDAFPRGTLCEDYDFNLQFLHATRNILRIDKPIIIYNWGVEGSVSNSAQTGGYEPKYQLGEAEYKKWFK